MPPNDDALTPADLINQELARELTRKESLERRGITVITTSGVLVTLIFAFSTAVAKGQHFGNFTLWEEALLVIGLGFFVVSGVFGMATNTPRNYGVLKISDLEAAIGASDEPVSHETLRHLIEVIRAARYANDNKAYALASSILMQVIAVVLVGITVAVVVI